MIPPDVVPRSVDHCRSVGGRRGGGSGASPFTPDRERLFVQHALTEFHDVSHVAIPVGVHFKAEELIFLRIAYFKVS